MDDGQGEGEIFRAFFAHFHFKKINKQCLKIAT